MSIEKVKCTKTQVLVKEGQRNDSIYLVRKGVFSGFTHHKTGGQKNFSMQNESCKDFLSGTGGNRFVRGIFNEKLKHCTKKPHLR